MYAARGRGEQYDVVDLDPYGSASPFLDGAVQAVKDGGLLMVTCTDLAVLAGQSNIEACFTKYGSVPVRGTHCHEQALRMVLHAVATSAARYRRAITPLLSLSIDFYVRLFVRVDDSPVAAKSVITQTGMLAQCTSCETFAVAPLGRVEQRGTSRVYKGARVAIGDHCATCGAACNVRGAAAPRRRARRSLL